MYLKFIFILHELGDKLCSPRGMAKRAGSIYRIKHLPPPHWIRVTLLFHYVSPNNLISFWTWNFVWVICLSRFCCVCANTMWYGLQKLYGELHIRQAPSLFSSAEMFRLFHTSSGCSQVFIFCMVCKSLPSSLNILTLPSRHLKFTGVITV